MEQELTGRQFGLITDNAERSRPSDDLVNQTLNKADYIIYSSLEKNYYYYFWGADPMSNITLARYGSSLYDNGAFHVYGNNFK